MLEHLQDNPVLMVMIILTGFTLLLRWIPSFTAVIGLSVAAGIAYGYHEGLLFL